MDSNKALDAVEKAINMAFDKCKANMEAYANQRVIEELDGMRNKFPSINKKYTDSIIDKRINQLIGVTNPSNFQ